MGCCDGRKNFGWPNHNYNSPWNTGNTLNIPMEFNETVNNSASNTNEERNEYRLRCLTYLRIRGKTTQLQSVKNHKCYISIESREKKFDRRQQSRTSNGKKSVKTNKITKAGRYKRREKERAREKKQ